jgi:ureidoglycolate hydrolase
MNGTRQLVAVCPSAPDGSPLASQLRVFVADGSQAVNYDADVWHAPRMALCAPGEFVMFRWDDGSALDTELRTLEVPIVVELPDPQRRERISRAVGRYAAAAGIAPR